MNKEKIQQELGKAWNKACSFPGQLELLPPEGLNPIVAANAIITLLEATYTHHAISNNPGALVAEIHSGAVQPWIVTRDKHPVACAALITQTDGRVELGRAASIENGSGAGKIAMLEAAMGLAKNNGKLVAEVRLADEFAGIPSGLATQKICFGTLGVIPHAVLPAFSHGDPIRHEMFAFATAETVLPKHNRPIGAAAHVFRERASHTSVHARKIHVVSDKPFRLAVPDDSGVGLTDFWQESRAPGQGCTVVAIEANDNNLSTITGLENRDFQLVGLDRNPGPTGLPVVLLATLARGTLLAPTKVGESLPINTRDDIQLIANLFEQILEK